MTSSASARSIATWLLVLGSGSCVGSAIPRTSTIDLKSDDGLSETIVDTSGMLVIDRSHGGEISTRVTAYGAQLIVGGKTRAEMITRESGDPTDPYNPTFILYDGTERSRIEIAVDTSGEAMVTVFDPGKQPKRLRVDR